MRSKISILLAVLALIASTLACAAGEPGMSNVRTSKDEDGKQLTAVFGKNDKIYVVSDLSNAVKGNTIATKWYVVKVEGVEPNFLIAESSKPIEDDTFDGIWIVSGDPPWEAGSYKVEVYFNNVLTSTVQFTVE